MNQAVQRIAALSPEKRALLARRHPLSFAQRRLWFLQQLAPADTSYNVPAALRLRGRLDVRKLRLSLDETVARHAILRTTFPDFDGKPLPTIAPAEPCPLPVIDLAGLPAARREAEGMGIVAGAAGRPFDLAAGPLVRALLVRFSAGEQVLLFELHHIVCDGWSREVLLRDVARLYGDRAAGRPSSLPEPSIQYADFARWQQEWLQSDACRRQLAYWRQRLQGSPPLLALPFDRPRSAAAGQPAGGASRRLPEELGERLARCGREENASAFMICLAAFCALLSRASGERDLPVGTPILNRGMLETEGVVGPFINLLVLRADLPAGATFRELLAQARRLTLEAHQHQDLPFEMLVDELRPERHPGVHPLFQVLFTLVVSPPAGAALDGLTVAPLAVGTGSAKYDLSLFVTQGERTLSVAAEWNAALFDATTSQRMLGHLERLLAAALADPAASCDDLPLLGEMESAQVLEGWNDTTVPVSSDVCIHDLLGLQAARTPDAPAVHFADLTLTYRQLDERAERLARQLAFLGIGREDLVGLCLERSLAMVVALLGVLKAGAAYLPLDPAFPAERLAFMLVDAGAAVVLADAAAPPAGIGAARVLRLAADGGLAEPAPGERPPVAAAPENRAYVLYTSGSTGRPKGVEVTHRAAVNFLLSMRRRPGLTARDTLLAVTTLSFDIHVLEIFLPLLAGARVVICDRLTAADGGTLRSALAAAAATALQATPVTWKLLLDAGWTGGSGFQVLCGGEALSQDLADALGASGAAVWNLFGPTETAVWSSVARLGPGLPVTLGRPIDNTRFCLLDARLAPVPIGYPGELYIGGAGVARGYLGRPELTAERFIPDPFGGGPGARLYRTGDRARWLADGRLDFLGRADQQVKVRGFRIELAEIEAALREHPAVRAAAVAVRHDADDSPGDRRLVAYVVQGSDLAASASQLMPRLRQHLQARLPAYMVPAAFVLLDRLPLTPNGKLDRRALPAPPAVSSAEGAAPPRSLTEELTAGIWSEVLRVAAVGIHDNFFDLGGHSLLAAQVVSRLRDAFGVEVPLRQLFDGPTVASVAAAVESALSERAGPQLPPLVPVPRDAELPLSFAQERLWSLHRLNPEDTTYNLVKAVRLVGPLQPVALAGALAEVVRRHEVLRTSFAPGHGGRPAQVIAPASDMDLPVVDLSALGERRQAEVRRQARSEGRLPFDLATGPPLRVRLLRLDQDEHVLLLAVHHIAVDLWSLGVLLREVVVLYQAGAAGRPSPLPELPLQYADFAVWQRGWLAGEEMARKLAYWRQKLAGYLQVVTFTSEGPRSRVPGARGARHAFQLPAELSGELAALGRRQGATLYMTLLAAYEVLLYVYSGQRDLVIGSPSAGRRFTETEGLVGFFLDTMPLRADLSGNPELRELVAQTRQSALEAYAHQEVPLQLIVEALPARRAPLVQVWFAFQNVPFQKVDPAELRFSLLDVEMGSTAPFDLALLMQDGGAGLTGVFEYRRDVLTSSSVARMAAGFRVLLETAVARPQARVEELAELVRDSDGRHRRAQEKDYAAAVGMRLQTVQKRAVRRHVIKVRT